MATAAHSVEVLTGLSPCVIALSADDVVAWASERLTKLLGVSIVGRHFDRIVVPADRPLLAFGLRTESGTVLPLRGNWIPWGTDGSRAFVGSPAPATTEEMRRLDITFDDFARNDTWLSYLIKADECATTQEDARKRIKQLKQERAKAARARDQMRDARLASLNMLSDLADAKRQAEEAHALLKKAHAETRHLFEAISSVLIGVDKDGRITAWNGAAERAFAMGKHDVSGRLLGDLEVNWDYAAVSDGVRKCLTTNAPVRLDDVRFEKPDGERGFLGITLNPVRSDSGVPVGVLFVAADITRNKILQGQLAQAQKMESIGLLAAGIAHEINTPIQYVGDNVRFLSESIDDLLKLIGSYRNLLAAAAKGSDGEEYLKKAAELEEDADLAYLEEEAPKSIAQSLDGVARVTRIVRAMKDFSHPGAEAKEAVDLNKTIESTITVARNEWKDVAEMVTDFDADLPPVPCLVGDFNQVILNIVVNAAHAIAAALQESGEEKGTITIATRRDGDWVEVRISDTGTGIPEEHRSKVFDHFFTTKEVGKGTGQGLSIAHGVITEKHGGTLTFETESGKGTTFVIRLPLDPDSSACDEASQLEEACSVR